MRSRWIVGLVALAAVGGMAAAADAVLGPEAAPTPRYAVVDINLRPATPPHARAAAAHRGAKKPRLTYLDSPAPATINPAPVAEGGIGPNIDVKLRGCSKVIDGGVVPSRTDVYVRGSYVKSKSEYHVLISLDANSVNTTAPDYTPFTITSNLTCLKGVK